MILVMFRKRSVNTRLRVFEDGISFMTCGETFLNNYRIE